MLNEFRVLLIYYIRYVPMDFHLNTTSPETQVHHPNDGCDSGIPLCPSGTSAHLQNISLVFWHFMTSQKIFLRFGYLRGQFLSVLLYFCMD